MLAVGDGDGHGNGDGGQRRLTQRRSCPPHMSAEDCEMLELREAVQRIEEEAKAKRGPLHPFMDRAALDAVVGVVESFLVARRLVCYGGTAINNILPRRAQFYDRDTEIPDYDFFSPDAMRDATDLALRFQARGYAEVEAKAGVHFGTIKVFVNFVGVADITQLPPALFARLRRAALVVDRVRYCPPDFLRMLVYAELCKPRGDVSRWQKVFRRYLLLDRHHPFRLQMHFKGMRAPRSPEAWARALAPPPASASAPAPKLLAKQKAKDLLEFVREHLARSGAVFFGAFAFSCYLPAQPAVFLACSGEHGGFFDALAENPEEAAEALAAALRLRQSAREEESGGEVVVVRHAQVMDLVPARVELRRGDTRLATLFEAWHCYNYNTAPAPAPAPTAAVPAAYRVATVDTMMYFFLSFFYLQLPQYDPRRLLGMVDFLLRGARQQKHGFFRRFAAECFGTEASLLEMRIRKAALYKLYVADRKAESEDSWQLRMHFFKFRPGGAVVTESPKRRRTRRRKRRR